MNKKPNYKFPGDSRMNIFLGLSTFLIFQIVFLLLIFYSDNLTGSIVAALLFLLITYFSSRSLISVSFYESNIECKYLYGNKKQIKYEDLISLENPKRVLTRATGPTYIIKYYSKSKRAKKITLSCSDEQLSLLKDYLISKQENLEYIEKEIW